MAKLTKNAIKLYKTHIVDVAPGKSFPWVPSTGHPGREQTEISAFSIQSAVKRGHFTEVWVGSPDDGHTEYVITEEGRAFGEKRIPAALLAQYRREAGQNIEESEENEREDMGEAEPPADGPEFPEVIANPKSGAKYTLLNRVPDLEGIPAAEYKDSRGRAKKITLATAQAWANHA